MKRDMKQWVEEIIKSPQKKAAPILSFPCSQLMGVGVKDLISDSDLQAKGMALVAERVDSGFSVSLMDLSVEAECFGSQIAVMEGEVPTVVGNIISNEQDVQALAVPPIGSGRTQIYINALEKALALVEDRPVLAGIIGPFTLAGRLMDVTNIMISCFEEPELVHAVLKKTTDFLIQYAKAYKDVGANGIVIAEPLAGLMSPELGEEFSSCYVKKIVEEVQDENFIVVYHNCGNSALSMIDSIIGTGASALHFGNAVNMEDALPKIPPHVLAMGNIDPAGEFKDGTPESIRNATLAILEKCSRYPNFVISSGCDIPPLAKWENIDAFFDAVIQFYSGKG